MADSNKSRRVCMITTAHNALDDRIYHKEALSLVKAGFEVGLVARWPSDANPGPVTPLRLPMSRGALARVFVLPLRAFLVALGFGARVYHFHDPDLLPVGLLLKLCGKRVVYDVHEDYSRKILSRGLPSGVARVVSWMMRRVEAFCAWTFDAIVAADSHVHALFDDSKSIVVANYPPVRFVQSAPSLNRPSDRFRIVYVGAVNLKRGIGKILDALDLIGDRRIEFHVAGKVAEPELEARLRSHPNTTYHGVLPWTRIPEVLAGSDVGMLALQPIPAFLYCPGENIIKLWEYLGTGMCVIISDFPKLKRLIGDLNAGLAVDPTNPASIAEAIVRLRDDRALCRQLGDNGRDAVMSTRNWENEEGKLVHMYEALTGAA